MCFQLVERTGPSLPMGTAGLFVMQERVSECYLRSFGNDLQHNLHARLIRILNAAFPAPAHHQPLRAYHLEIFAAAFVLRAVERTETHAIAAALARIRLRDQHRTGIGAPPLRDAFRGRHRVENDRLSCLDPPHKCKARHRSLPRASASLRSAWAASLARPPLQNRSYRFSHAMASRIGWNRSQTV